MGLLAGYPCRKKKKSSCGFMWFVMPGSLFHVGMEVPVAPRLKGQPGLYPGHLPTELPCHYVAVRVFSLTLYFLGRNISPSHVVHGSWGRSTPPKWIKNLTSSHLTCYSLWSNFWNWLWVLNHLQGLICSITGYSKLFWSEGASCLP